MDGCLHRWFDGIKTDNRTVFAYKRKNSPSDEDDVLTQYGYACKQLGIEIETSSVPEFKARIERVFKTFQNRLPRLFELNGIHTLLKKPISTFQST